MSDGQLLPVQTLIKGTGAAPPTLRRLAGWITTYGTLGPNGEVIPTRDREGHIFEAAKQLGQIDWSEYLTKGRGVWNYAHTSIRVGVPELIEFHDGTTELSQAHRKVGFWGTGHLFERGVPESWDGLPEPTQEEFDRADYCWGLATDLKKGPRPLGFSAEGRMRMSPCRTRILAAWVAKSAVLEFPHNPDATAEPLIKGRGLGALRVAGCSCARCSGGRLGPTADLARRYALAKGVDFKQARAMVAARLHSQMEIG